MPCEIQMVISVGKPDLQIGALNPPSLCAPSLSMIRVGWQVAVLKVMPSAAAISLLVFPDAMRVKTSHSRTVRASRFVFVRTGPDIWLSLVSLEGPAGLGRTSHAGGKFG